MGTLAAKEISAGRSAMRAYDSVMPQRSRPYRVQVKLDEAEHARLVEEAARQGLSRSEAMRQAVAWWAGGGATAGVPTRREALQLLAGQARSGSALATQALARELRLQPLDEPAPAVLEGRVSVRDLPAGALRVVK
jgi:hypothetical protein